MTITLQDITPGRVKPHPKNPRGDVGDVAELAASIREQGILEPLIVAPNTPHPTFVLIAGHRRLAAAKEARCKTVPCIVRADLTEPAAQLEAMLVENLQRVDLTPIEEAAGYQQLLEFPGYTVKRIAQATGRSQATVRGRVAVANLPDKARDAVHSGQLNLADALAITEFAKDADVLANLTKAIGTHDFPYQLARAKERKKKAARQAASEKKLAAGFPGLDMTVLDAAPSWNDAARITESKRTEHNEHGGLVAWIGYDGAIEWGCTSQDIHRAAVVAQRVTADDAGTPAPVDDDRAEWEQKREAVEKLRAELKVAATVRRAHLADVVDRGADSPIAHEILLRLATYSASTVPQFAMEILGLEYSPDTEPDDNDAQVAKRLGALNVNQLAITLDLLLNANPDGDLETPAGWGNGFGDSAKGWRHRLGTTYGYEWSQVELDQLEKHPDAQGPLTAEEADESDGYEHSDLRDAIDEFGDEA